MYDASEGQTAACHSTGKSFRKRQPRSLPREAEFSQAPETAAPNCRTGPRWPLAGEVCGDDPRGDEGEPRDGAVFFGTSFIRRVRLETQVRLAPASPKSDDVPAATLGQWRIDSWAQIPAGSPCQTDQAAEVRATAIGPGLLENYLGVKFYIEFCSMPKAMKLF